MASLIFHIVNFRLLHIFSTHRTLLISRATVKEDLIQEFKDMALMKCKLKIAFKDERGVDLEGLSREALSVFWDMFFMTCSDGEVERVPILKTQYGREEWLSVGRILLKGIQDCNFFPIKLSPAFVMAIVSGPGGVSDELLLKSLINFLSPDEAEILQDILSGSAHEDQEELMDILDRFSVNFVPTQAALREVLIQVAHKVFVQKPKYIVDVMAEAISKELRVYFPNEAAILGLYDAKTPNTKKVVKLLQADVQSEVQRKTFGFLKQFIRGLHYNELQKFLRFVTGSPVICVEAIQVTFSDISGWDRAIVARTCGAVLEVPCSYSSYGDMRNEFAAVLGGNCFKFNLC